jgi:hypothetical protein
MDETWFTSKPGLDSDSHDQVHSCAGESVRLKLKEAFLNTTAPYLKNRQGKTRLSKWYVPYDDDEKVGSSLDVLYTAIEAESLKRQSANL